MVFVAVRQREKIRGCAERFQSKLTKDVFDCEERAALNEAVDIDTDGQRTALHLQMECRRSEHFRSLGFIGQ